MGTREPNRHLDRGLRVGSSVHGHHRRRARLQSGESVSVGLWTQQLDGRWLVSEFHYANGRLDPNDESLID
jgi:hypothetical protein